MDRKKLVAEFKERMSPFIEGWNSGRFDTEYDRSSRKKGMQVYGNILDGLYDDSISIEEIIADAQWDYKHNENSIDEYLRDLHNVPNSDVEDLYYSYIRDARYENKMLEECIATLKEIQIAVVNSPDAYAYRINSSMVDIDVMYVSNSLEKLKSIKVSAIEKSIYEYSREEDDDPFGKTAEKFGLEMFDSESQDWEYVDNLETIELNDGRIVKIIDDGSVRV